MRNDRKQPHFQLSHQACVSLSPSFQIIHIFPPLLPALLSGSFVADLPPDLLQNSLFQLSKQKGERGGTSGKTGLEKTVKMMRRDSRPDRGSTSGPGVFQYLGQRQFTG